MPTVLRVGAYRFFFFAGDRDEPPHIHVRRDDNEAKFWLEPVRLQRNIGFGKNELSQVAKLIVVHQRRLRDEWNEYFSQ